jgi:hypothetical protein
VNFHDPFKKKDRGFLRFAHDLLLFFFVILRKVSQWDSPASLDYQPATTTDEIVLM